MEIPCCEAGSLALAVTITFTVSEQPKTVPFDQLASSGLFVDAIYESGTGHGVKADPLDPLLSVGNQGGFRQRGSLKSLRLCVLYSDMADPDWPDSIDLATGEFTYFGDNKKPGNELHDTPRRGNQILRRSFDNLHVGNRDQVPPFFVFTKGPKGRDVVFRGLAVPGAPGLNPTEDLVAIWKSKGGQRFQNYRAVFTVLDVPSISREWIASIQCF